MKGKKFDAAEKHFLKKEVKYKQIISEHSQHNRALWKVNEQLKSEKYDMEKELGLLKEKYNKLLEYSKLSDDDIMNALKRNKAMTQMAQMLSGSLYAHLLR